VDGALAELQRIGVRLAPKVDLDDFLASLDGDRKTSVDRIRLLCVLGGEAEVGDVPRYSDDIWHFDAECIEDDGDYARLAERFAALTKGEIQLSDLSDHVDVQSGEAWLEFTFRGCRERWEMTVDNDWMDPVLYASFQELARSVGSSGKFMICALGQDSLVLFGNETLRQEISDFTGLKFHWQ